MVLTLEDFNGMEIFWTQLNRVPDEDHCTLDPAEIDFMWHLGIIDTKKYPLEDWRAVFDSYKQPNGKFVLSKNEFLALEPYRYKGEIMVPFDALRINEGKYTDEGLQELFDLSIEPSCSMPPKELKSFLEELKSEFKEKDQLIRIDFRAKTKIKRIIDEFPSPLRRLEILFDLMLKNPDASVAMPSTSTSAAGSKTSSSEPPVGVSYRVSPAELAKIQASSFSMMPRNDTEAKYKGLKKLEKAKGKKASEPEKKTGTALKKIKRTRKGMRG